MHLNPVFYILKSIIRHKGVRVRRAVQIQFACTVALLISTSGFYTLSIAFNQGSLLSELGAEIDPQKELTLVYLEQGVMTVLLSINVSTSKYRLAITRDNLVMFQDIHQ